MLVLTDAATTVVRALVDGSALPATAGLRITGTHDGPGPLAVSPAPAPRRGDRVVEQSGARVFLEPSAAVLLEDRVLDASVDEEGRVRLVLTAQ